MKWKLLIFTALLLTGVAAHAVTKKTQLHKLIYNIKSLKTHLAYSHHKQRIIIKKLKQNETAAGTLAIKLHHIDRELYIKKRLLNRLHKDQLYYHDKLQAQQNNLASQMRAVYMLGNKSYLKLLLNRKNISQSSRFFTYYGYLQQSRLHLIQDLHDTLAKLQKTQHRISIETNKLLKLQKQQRHTYKILKHSKKYRSYLLQIINHRINTQQQRLAVLVANKKALEKLIARLKAAAISQVFATPLSKLHRKLHWPTKGKINNEFGHKIKNSQIHWGGVIIHAPFNNKVYAIADGKVVFAQWLRGYGLLIIINHGHGYMSLYGRNNSLYLKVGDIVHARELIATVGDSGGYKEPSLYFAIRHNGSPVNPKLWCR